MLPKRFIGLSTAALLACYAVQPAAYAASADAPKAFFINLKDGDTVTSPVKISFGLSGMKVAPAGTNTPNTGHFHVLIDTQLTPEEAQSAIPKDDQHLHFGKGQTDATLTLTPGEHTLQLVMGDGNHMLHKPPVESAVIHVTVKP